nr:adenylate/guanylate cyclase domain-containing protein [Alsobacter ponti]
MSAAEAHLGRLDAARDAQNDGLEQARRESLAFATGAVDLTRESGRDVIRLTLATLAFAVLLGLLMAFWITRRVVSSIRRLVVATEAAEKGHYETDLPVVSRDEIGRLSQAFNAMLAELRLKTRIRETFGRYLDPKVVEGLLDRPDLVAAAGERRLMTVAFADMRGFTRLSEQVTPALLVSVLNRYLTVLTEEIRSRNGVVDKYIGDAVMSFWGPPFVSEADEARLACETALAQARRFSQFQAELPDLLGIRSFTPDLGLRISIATGEVVAGSVGSATAMNFTVMGDAVNVASRLEALNRVYGTVVLVSEATARLVQGEFALREVDRVVVLGRETPLSVFELVGRPDDLPADTERALRLYETGLAAYRRKAWDDAAAAFRACLELRPADGPATALLARVTQFAGKPTPADWEGTWVAREK